MGKRGEAMDEIKKQTEEENSLRVKNVYAG